MKNKHIWLIIAGVMGLSIIVGLVVWSRQTQQMSNYMTRSEFMDKFHVIQKKWNGIIPASVFYETLGNPAHIKSIGFFGGLDLYEFEYKVQNGVVVLRVNDVGERLVAPSKYENCLRVRALPETSK